MAAHEDLSVVLVKSTLVVTNSWHVLDYNGVIWVFALLVEHGIGLNHIINNVRLGDLLRTELLLGAKILAIVVSKMIVAGNGGKLDTSTDQEVNKGRFHLGLARLEVVPSNESIVLLGKFDSTWNEGVLGRAVDEWHAFKDTGNRKHSRWCNFFMAVFNGLHEVISSVIDAVNELCKSLSVCSPLDNDLLQRVFGFKITMLLSAGVSLKSIV